MSVAAALCLTGCEYEFDNGSLTKETSIYIEGTPTNTDTNIFRIVRTIPYNTPDNAKDSANLHITEVSSLELLRDGVKQEVFYADKAVGSVPHGRYYTLGGYKPGEKLSLKVEMKGEKKVSAETVIPQSVNWEYEVTPVVSEKDDNDVRYHISISFDNNPGQDDFYGIFVEVDSRITYYNEDGSVNPYYGNAYNYAINPPIEEGDEIEDIMAGEGDSHVFEYGDIYLFDDTSLKDGRNTISYDTKFWRPYYYDKVKTKGYGGDDWTFPVKYHTEYKYRMHLYSISRELYRWYASRYNASYNPLAELGLCPPSFAYGNVRNGIGCFAGQFGYTSDWGVIVDEWVDVDRNYY